MILTICMPTYNRKEKALLQIQNIIRQCANLSETEIEYLISDNCSPDNTTSYLLEQLPFIPQYVKIDRQEQNLGLVGNLYYLFHEAKGEYVWFVSDDDKVCEESVPSVLQLIKERKKDFYMLNFRTEQNDKLSGSNYWSPNDHLLELFNDKTWGGFGLLSVQVLKKSLFTCLYNDKSDYNLCQPVAISLYGLVQLQGMIDFSKTYVIHHVGDYSWQKESTKVGSIYLFQALQSLKDKTTRENYVKILDVLSRCTCFCCYSAKYCIQTRDKTYIRQLRQEHIADRVLSKALWFYSISIPRHILHYIKSKVLNK